MFVAAGRIDTAAASVEGIAGENAIRRLTSPGRRLKAICYTLASLGFRCEIFALQILSRPLRETPDELTNRSGELFTAGVLTRHSPHEGAARLAELVAPIDHYRPSFLECHRRRPGFGWRRRPCGSRRGSRFGFGFGCTLKLNRLIG